ncbi:MAG: 1-phosphofructokinase family hexose kinase [Moraxella sp.]|nr:1-phosphofructokinase family hexose kinase [Moraxella sp.]
MSVLCITLNPAIDMTVAVDGLSVGSVNRATDTWSNAAGKGLNAAQILSDLGFETLSSGFLGADNAAIFDKLFAEREQLAQSKDVGSVRDAFVRVAGQTRTNIKLIDGGTTTDINGKGFVVNAADKARLIQKIADVAGECDAILVAGSLPQGFNEQDFDELLTFLTSIHDKVAVDVSGRALTIALKHRLWLIKPNNDELFEVFGEPADTLSEQAALVANLNIDNVVVSMGEKGVHWFSKNIYRATPPTMTVKSTVGAGDTLVAGMMAGLLQNKAPQDILARATALSAHAVSIVGFKAADTDQLAQLLPQVVVQDVSDQA